MPRHSGQARAVALFLAGAALAGEAFAATPTPPSIAAARHALAAQHYAQARQQLDHLIAQQPDNRDARFLKGLVLARSRDTKGAIQVFAKLAHTNPGMAAAWNNLGVLHARRGELQAAQHALEKAVKLAPGYPAAQENLGDVYIARAGHAYRRAAHDQQATATAKRKSQKLAEFLAGKAAFGAAAAAKDNANRHLGKPASANRASQANETADPGKKDQHKTTTASARAAIKQALRRWAKAWSNHNSQAYFGAYSDNFQPPGGQPMAAWIGKRRAAMHASQSVTVTVSHIRVTPEDADHAVAHFEQTAHSNNAEQKAHTNKTMSLIHENGGWRIKRES